MTAVNERARYTQVGGAHSLSHNYSELAITLSKRNGLYPVRGRGCLLISRETRIQ